MARSDSYYANYRLVFLLMVLRAVAPPLAIAAIICKIHRSYTVLTCLLAFPAYWTIRIQYSLYSKRRDAARKGAILVPEVNGSWIGNIDIMLWMSGIMRTGYAVDDLNALFERAGKNVHTVNVRLLWSDTIFTRDHRVVQHALTTGFNDFKKGVKLEYALMFGDGIFNTDGAEWKAHRALIRPFFARGRVTDYGHFDKCCNKVIELLKERADAGESIDVQDIFSRFTIDMAGEFFFGEPDWNTLDAPLRLPGKAGTSPEGEYSGYNDFVKATDAMQDAVLKRRPWGRMWPMREIFRDLSADANHVVDKWIKPLIHRAMDAKAKSGGDKDLMEGSFLDHMVHSTNDVRTIRDELVNILVAARDSTTALLTFLFYLLSLHPEVLSKLRSEILAVVPVGPPGHNDVRKLRYLRACFDETLRLFSPIPVNRRTSTRSCVLPVPSVDAQGNRGPIYMPGPDVPLVYSPLLAQRRQDLWGEDAEEFIPERWIDPDRTKDSPADLFRFFPFSAGPRVCPGQDYAYNEASYLAIRILQTFDTLELRQEDAPQGSQPPAEWKSKGGRHAVERIWPMAALTMQSKGGVWLRVKLAQK